MSPKPGTRLRCTACGAEAIVVRAGEAQLSCCGRALEPTFTPPAPGGGR